MCNAGCPKRLGAQKAFLVMLQMLGAPKARNEIPCRIVVPFADKSEGFLYIYV